MSTRRYSIISCAAAWVLLLAPDATLAAPADAMSRFAEAHAAYRNGERVHLSKVAESLRDTDYAPWVEQWRLRLRMEEDMYDGVKEFLDREAGSYLAEKLRTEWLRRLGKAQSWQTFQREFPSLQQPDQDLTCYALQARLERQQDVTALDEARPIWFNALEMPESCRPLMDRLFAESRLVADDVWMRMRKLVEGKKLAGLRYVAARLPAGNQLDVRRLDSAVDMPARYLAKLPPDFAAQRTGRELALLAVVRLSRTDPIAAADHWQHLNDHYTAPDRRYVWGQIAWQAAVMHKPEAAKWYARAVDGQLNDEQHAWAVRSALRARDWAEVAAAIGRMPVRLSGQPEWIYWRARANAALGRREEARLQLETIAGQPQFYGILADEELGRSITIPPAPEPLTTDEIATAATRPGVRRALAVLRAELGPEMRMEAVREWAWTMRGLTDRELLAAAEVARRAGAIDRSISAAERTQLSHDFTLRYPAPFRAEVAAKARATSLDDAWVYGLIRQESRFVIEARSSVGARGLMQLMPATASWVARRIGYADYQLARVTDTDTNITLGTNYLKMVFDALDQHPVLASAAYNAGPNRARRWRADRPLEGAVYVETIPFNETRDYVKKVMSNAVYYATLFNEQPQSLKARLGVIRPPGASETAVDLP